MAVHRANASFFDISKKISSLPRSILLIISDLVLTINLFTLIYAYVVGGAIFLDDRGEVNLSLSSDVRVDERKADDFRDPGKLELLTAATFYDFYYNVKIKNLYDEREDETIFSFYTDDASVNLSDALTILFGEGSLKVSAHKLELHKKNVTVDCAFRPSAEHCVTPEVSESLPMSDRGLEKWIELRKNGYLSESEALNLKVRQGGEDAFLHAYTLAYSEVDYLQDGFPQTLSPNMISTSYSRILGDYYNAKLCCPGGRINPDTDYIYACEIPEYGWISHLDKELFNYPCARKIMMPFTYAWIFYRDLNYMESDLLGVEVPLNTFFMTSLLSTAFLYSVAVFLFLAVLGRNLLYKTLKKSEKYFMRSPFACTGFILGLLIFLVDLIA